MNRIDPTALAAQIIAQVKGELNVGDLVEQARVTLKVTTKPEMDALNLTGQQAIAVNEMYARADELDKIAKAATEERERIKQVLRDTLGEGHVLKANGIPVFTNAPVETRRLNQAAVKSKFPDIPGNEWAYETATSRSARFK